MNKTEAIERINSLPEEADVDVVICGRKPRIHTLASSLARKLGYTLPKIQDKYRGQDMLFPRVAIAEKLREWQYTYMEIGAVLGRDHATIIHYMRNLEGFRYYRDFRKLEEKLTEK